MDHNDSLIISGEGSRTPDPADEWIDEEDSPTSRLPPHHPLRGVTTDQGEEPDILKWIRKEHKPLEFIPEHPSTPRRSKAAAAYSTIRLEPPGTEYVSKHALTPRPSITPAGPFSREGKRTNDGGRSPFPPLRSRREEEEEEEGERQEAAKRNVEGQGTPRMRHRLSVMQLGKKMVDVLHVPVLKRRVNRAGVKNNEEAERVLREHKPDSRVPQNLPPGAKKFLLGPE